MGTDIRELSWMSDATKQRALEKLNSIVNKIGYPDKWRDYSSLEIVRGDFMGNVQRANAFEHRRELAKIGKPVDRGEWQMTPPTVNAYYDPADERHQLPRGSAATAALRSENGRRSELRQYRRDNRPRTDARLR